MIFLIRQKVFGPALTSFLFFDELLVTTFIDSNGSNSEFEYFLRREKQHKARRKTPNIDNKIALNLVIKNENISAYV